MEDQFREGSEAEGQSRRQFLRAACAPALLAMLGITVTSCESTEPDEGNPPGGGNPNSGISINGKVITLDLTKADVMVLASAGGAKHIQGASVIAAKVGGTIRAFSSICPHEGGTINTFSNSRFTCSLHGSQFNTSGSVVQGPATTNMTEFAVSQNGNTVVITKP